MSAHDSRFLRGTPHRDAPTERELQVGALRKQGLSRREVAERLGISMTSVERAEHNLADIQARAKQTS